MTRRQRNRLDRLAHRLAVLSRELYADAAWLDRTREAADASPSVYTAGTYCAHASHGLYARLRDLTGK